MALSSISTGRLPISLQSSRLLTAVGEGRAAIAKLEMQLQTQRKFTVPSEMPVAAIQALSLYRISLLQETISGNETINDGFLAAADQQLSVAGDALVRARAIVSEGMGENATAEQKAALANEVQTLIQSVLNAANGTYNNRKLFGGSQSIGNPFSLTAEGAVRYGGDTAELQTFADVDLLVGSNLSGAAAFGALSKAISGDLNPTVAWTDRLSELNGSGIVPDRISISVVDGGPAITKDVDLRGAVTLDDVRLRIEQAFAAESITVSVGFNAGNNGLAVTPSSGTISIADVTGSRTARDLGLVATNVATISGNDLDPPISNATLLSSLNGGTGIGATAGTGLRIVNGSTTTVVDLNGAVTVGDVLNRIRTATGDVTAELSADGRGIAISTRLSGVPFSIGENGGDNATRLGLRTLTGTTAVADLNRGEGLTNDPSALSITRRDGTTVSVDLTGVATVQDVLDRINAIDPGHLTASLASVGNGLALTDDSGSGSLTVAESELSRRLGINGTEATGAAGVLTGQDVNPHEADGVFTVLLQLEKALRAGDNTELSRLTARIDEASATVTLRRSDIGTRQQILQRASDVLKDAAISTKAQISNLIETDMTELITQLAQRQAALEATYQVAANTMNLSLLQYL